MTIVIVATIVIIVNITDAIYTKPGLLILPIFSGLQTREVY